MPDLTLEEVIEAWRGLRHPGDDTPESRKRLRVRVQIMSLLSEGRPATVAEVASRTELSSDEISEVFNQMQAGGAEVDDDGNLVGAALTLNPTPHSFRVNGHDLYAWCSLDTLFLPGLIEQTALVESTCPVTGDRIQLTVTPDEVRELDPSGSVLSITVPGLTPSCGPGSQSGPQSAVCSSMHFFSSREAASSWVEEHPGVAVLTLDEAFRLAQEVWVEPWRKLRGEVAVS